MANELYFQLCLLMHVTCLGAVNFLKDFNKLFVLWIKHILKYIIGIHSVNWLKNCDQTYIKIDCIVKRVGQDVIWSSCYSGYCG